ncbi:MAG: hypothetical protein E7521_08020 [Ruminococcaceae bacterium]|nr:hypothetical protein [Oscillospiraceae bacterium]
MVRKLIVLFLSVVMILSAVGCKSDGLPKYPEKSFEISGFWAPYELTEETFKQYKDVGFTTFAMINHSLEKNSENQFYLGSDRTMKALELCRKTGLKAILQYGDWLATWSEQNEDYYNETPFSQHDLYGEYKDIITGISIVDEPSKDHYDGRYNSKAMMDDFQKVYPDAYYIVNLSPRYAGGTYWDFANYDELVDTYEKEIMTHFDKKFISVDCYPFRNEEKNKYARHQDWLLGHEIIANLAKKHDAYKTAIIQSSVTNEFASVLTEGDMRLQVNVALAFGFDHIQYYCYEVPRSYNEDGTVNYMYEHCILNQDSTPNEMYYWLQDIHKEIQSFSSVILAYDWDSIIARNPVGFSSNTDMMQMLDREFENAKHFDKTISSTDVAISRFTSEKYGEAYMFVNYAQRDAKNNVVTATFKDCKKVAVYGGNGFDGTPKIVELDEEGKCRFEFEYGEGAFVVPVV